MQRTIGFAALLILALAPVGRAPSDHAAVLQVVKRVFDGMRTRDTALMRAQFEPSARLLSIDKKSGAPRVQVSDPGGWIAAVARGTGPAWDERIFDPVVELDDNIAHVWAYYEFWRGDQLSHCGYDSFFLVKLGDEWKVSQVADSRRTDCKPRR